MIVLGNAVVADAEEFAHVGELGFEFAVVVDDN